VAVELSAMAARQPFTFAVVVPAGRDPFGRVCYTHFTYGQLDRDSDELAHGLRAMGIVAGMRAVVMVRPGLDFFSLVFALFKAGVVPVLIDPGIGLRHLSRCCHETQPEVFIGIPKAVLAQRILGWGRPTVSHVLVVAPRGAWLGHRTLGHVRRAGRAARECGPAASLFGESCSPDAMAAILYTSGSTGPPKGAIYTHSILSAQVERIRELFAIEPGEIDLCTFPLFALFAPALGMTAIVPDMDPTRPALADPAKLAEAIENFGVTNLFGSPALLRRLGGADQEVLSRAPAKLTTLKRVVSAGAPVTATVLQGMAGRLVPPACVYPTYGATEALPVASIGSDDVLCETRYATEQGRGVCVGWPVGGIEVRIIRIDDDPIPSWSADLLVPDGTIGEIVVAGAVVTREYYNRPEATKLAKIADQNRSIVYHRMGDLGYQDEQGRLWFCGRKSHRVVLAEETLYTIPCEGIFNTHPAVFRTALVGFNRRGETLPVLCVEPLRRQTKHEQEVLRRELLERGSRFPHTRRIRTILFHPGFPVDVRHNSKIFREKLTVWAARRLT
jgi:acyl-CoA synthetase (AMP-forming)/AMP-acid ligase II